MRTRSSVALVLLWASSGCALVMGYDDYGDDPSGSEATGSGTGAGSPAGTGSGTEAGPGPGAGAGTSTSTGDPGSGGAGPGPGSGGAGGEGASGPGSGGSGAGSLVCDDPTDCPGAETECQTRACVGATCGVDLTPDGTPVTEQVAGDCRVNVCDGNGTEVSRADPTDPPPDDGNPCTIEGCDGVEPVTTFAPAGSPCGQGGGLTCDGAGSCQGCDAPQDCGAPGPCFAWQCVSGDCQQSGLGDGTPCGSSAQCAGGVFQPGDTCQGIVCVDQGTQSCGAYACNGNVACHTAPCENDGECAPNHFCQGASNCVPRKALGQTCSGANECASGFCEDSVCCDTDCSAEGDCRKCRQDLKLNGVSGNCGQARPDLVCSAEPVCASDHETGQLVCGFSGTCTSVSQPTSDCGLFACQAGSCLASCFGGSDCAIGARCEGGGCCATCSMLLDTANDVSVSDTCGSSSKAVDKLTSVACGPCINVCGGLCSDQGPVSFACATCIDNQGKGNVLIDCVQDD